MSDSDWMVDRRGWYSERERASGTGAAAADDGADDAMGYEAAYPSPLPAPLPDRGDAKEQR
jgi:hypothetical protein